MDTLAKPNHELIALISYSMLFHAIPAYSEHSEYFCTGRTLSERLSQNTHLSLTNTNTNTNTND